MVWEEVDNDYRVGTIRGGNGARRHTQTHAHWRACVGVQGRSREAERKVAERMGRIRREENRMAREEE